MADQANQEVVVEDSSREVVTGGRIATSAATAVGDPRSAGEVHDPSHP